MHFHNWFTRADYTPPKVEIQPAPQWTETTTTTHIPAEVWRLTEHPNPERDAYLREMIKRYGEA